MDRPAPARPPPHSPSPTSSSGCYSLPPIASNSILISVSFITIALRVLLVKCVLVTLDVVLWCGILLIKKEKEKKNSKRENVAEKVVEL